MFILGAITDGSVNIDGQARTYSYFCDSNITIRVWTRKSPLEQLEIWAGCLLQWQAVTQPLTRTLIVMDAASGNVGMTMVMILNKEMLLLFNLEMASL